MIIASYNAEDTIGQCLDHVYASTFRDFEVIVVDDQSTDATRKIVQSYPCKLFTTKENVGPGPARNLGAAHAAGRYFYFLDADILVKPDTLTQIVELLDARPEFSGLIGSFEKNTPAENFVSSYKNLLHHYTHQNSEEESSTFCGGLGVLRRDAFFAVGGFNSQWRYMEDIDLGYRLHRAGYRLWLNKSFQATHLKRYTLTRLIRSDVFARAIPWTQIMLETRIFRNDLSTRSHHVASVPLSFLMLAVLCCPLPWILCDLPLAMTFFLLNRGFLQFIRQERGTVFAARGAVMCWFAYLYSGVGAGLGVACHLRKSLRREPMIGALVIGAEDTR